MDMLELFDRTYISQRLLAFIFEMENEKDSNVFVMKMIEEFKKFYLRSKSLKLKKIRKESIFIFANTQKEYLKLIDFG